MEGDHLCCHPSSRAPFLSPGLCRSCHSQVCPQHACYRGAPCIEVPGLAHRRASPSPSRSWQGCVGPTFHLRPRYGVKVCRHRDVRVPRSLMPQGQILGGQGPDFLALPEEILAALKRHFRELSPWKSGSRLVFCTAPRRSRLRPGRRLQRAWVARARTCWASPGQSVKSKGGEGDAIGRRPAPFAGQRRRPVVAGGMLGAPELRPSR